MKRFINLCHRRCYIINSETYFNKINTAPWFKDTATLIGPASFPHRQLVRGVSIEAVIMFFDKDVELIFNLKHGHESRRVNPKLKFYKMTSQYGQIHDRVIRYADGVYSNWHKCLRERLIKDPATLCDPIMDGWMNFHELYHCDLTHAQMQESITPNYMRCETAKSFTIEPKKTFTYYYETEEEKIKNEEYDRRCLEEFDNE